MMFRWKNYCSTSSDADVKRYYLARNSAFKHTYNIRYCWFWQIVRKRMLHRYYNNGCSAHLCANFPAAKQAKLLEYKIRTICLVIIKRIL